MAKVNYVACTSCHKEYYIDRILSDALVVNPRLKLKCPYCKKEFQLKAGPDGARQDDALATARR